MKKWICLCLIMLLCAAVCAMLAEGKALPANDEPPVEKTWRTGGLKPLGRSKKRPSPCRTAQSAWSSIKTPTARRAMSWRA